jgi:hypothetical protein
LAGLLHDRAARRTRAQRAAATAAAGWTFSALWHLLALAVLVMEIHPFQIPQTTPTVTVELMPPLIPEKPLERIEPQPQPPQRIELNPPTPEPIKPIQVQKAPTAQAVKPVLTKPLVIQQPPTVTPPTVAPPVPAAPTEAPRALKPITLRPMDVQRPAAPVTAAPSLAKPLQILAPPTVSAQPVEAPAPPAPPRTVSVQQPSQVVPQRAAPLPVLTNDQTTVGPIEIRPPDHPQRAAQPGGAALPPAGGAAAGNPGGGGAAGGGSPYTGPIAGFDQKGLHTTLGCLNQDTYHLSAADRAACLQRVAREAQGLRDLGPNIPADKKAEYDHKVACHDAYAGQATPGVAEASTGTSIRGLGNVPSLTDCSPADR